LTSRFRLEIPFRDAANGLYAALKAVLATKGKQLVFDEATKAQTAEVAKWLISPSSAPGLLLCGNVGNGKTSMALAITWLIHYVTEIELGYSKAKSPHIYHAKEICRIYSENLKVFDEIVNDPMIIIDDLGDEPTEQMHYGTIITPVIDLIEERYNRRVMTIATTNLGAKDLQDKYGLRIRDRLRESMQMVVYKQPSYRKA
jgi:DNA replication protein DnaC